MGAGAARGRARGAWARARRAARGRAGATRGRGASSSHDRPGGGILSPGGSRQRVPPRSDHAVPTRLCANYCAPDSAPPVRTVSCGIHRAPVRTRPARSPLPARSPVGTPATPRPADAAAPGPARHTAVPPGSRPGPRPVAVTSTLLVSPPQTSARRINHDGVLTGVTEIDRAAVRAQMCGNAMCPVETPGPPPARRDPRAMLGGLVSGSSCRGPRVGGLRDRGKLSRAGVRARTRIRSACSRSPGSRWWGRRR